jgi:hypothetical protein
VREREAKSWLRCTRGEASLAGGAHARVRIQRRVQHAQQRVDARI